MHANATPGTLLAELRTRIPAIATAVVSSNGTVIGASLLDGTYASPFAVMCATAMGAAVAANRELGLADADRLVIESGDARTWLLRMGPDTLLVVVLPLDVDFERVREETGRFIAQWVPG